jgi:hypothetical protein
MAVVSSPGGRFSFLSFFWRGDFPPEMGGPVDHCTSRPAILPDSSYPTPFAKLLIQLDVDQSSIGTGTLPGNNPNDPPPLLCTPTPSGIEINNCGEVCQVSCIKKTERSRPDQGSPLVDPATIFLNKKKNRILRRYRSSSDKNQTTSES